MKNKSDRGHGRGYPVSDDPSVHHHEAASDVSPLVPAESPDRRSGGVLELVGHFFTEHKDEVLGLIRSVEEKQAERILGIEERRDGSVVIRFTTPFLARLVGDELYRHYWGELELRQTRGGQDVLITWWR